MTYNWQNKRSHIIYLFETAYKRYTVQNLHTKLHKVKSNDSWITMWQQWSLYVPPGITFNNSTFCPHSVFMCFLLIAELKAIISIYNINWLVFIANTECVYCAVRTGSLNTTAVNPGLYKQSTVHGLNLLQSTRQHMGTQNHSQLHVLCEKKICHTGLQICCINLLHMPADMLH
jgi:hypothetical protein